MVAASQFISHVPGRLAGSGAVHHVGGAEGLGEGLGEFVLDQVLAMAVMPHQLAGVVGTDLFQPAGYFVQRLVPRDLHPTRILVGALLWVGAFKRGLDPIGVIGVEGAGGALGADALVVELGTGRIRVDGADDITIHLHHLAAEVYTMTASGLLVMLACGIGDFAGLGGSLGNYGQLRTYACSAGQGTRALQKATAGNEHSNKSSSVG